MSRLYPYKLKPTAHDTDLLQQLTTQSFLLIQRPGACVFIIQTPTTTPSTNHRVTLGEPQRCTCHPTPTHTDAATMQLCVHVMFVMHKVLKLPATHPLLYQHGLLDSDIDTIFSHRHTTPPAHRRPHRRSSQQQADGDGGGGGVARREIEDGDTCCVCYDDLTNQLTSPYYQSLVHCTTCRHAIHAQCMLTYIRHQMSVAQHHQQQQRDDNGAKPVCPLCRSAWLQSQSDIQRVIDADAKQRRLLKQKQQPRKLPTTKPTQHAGDDAGDLENRLNGLSIAGSRWTTGSTQLPRINAHRTQSTPAQTVQSHRYRPTVQHSMPPAIQLMHRAVSMDRSMPQVSNTRQVCAPRGRVYRGRANLVPRSRTLVVDMSVQAVALS